MTSNRFLGILVRMDRLDDHINTSRSNFWKFSRGGLRLWTTSKKVTSNKEDSDFLGGQTTSNVRIAQRPNKNTGRNRKNWGEL